MRNTIRPFGATHGEPMAWDWDAVTRWGIADLDRPDWGVAAPSLQGGLLGAQ